jgi:hypothetical protein
MSVRCARQPASGYMSNSLGYFVNSRGPSRLTLQTAQVPGFVGQGGGQRSRP